METNFTGANTYTVGIEEEFQLVDPATRELSPAIDAVLAGGRELNWITSELSQSCVELVSPVYGNVAQVAKELPRLRNELGALARSCGVELVAAGTHPFSNPVAQPFTRGAHHLKVEEHMGWVARTQAIYGLHVHVAVPDEESAIQATKVLSRHVPLVIALSGNSPFWRGSDTRLSSTRIKVFEIFPRSGLPPAFDRWEDFQNHVDTIVASGNIPDYTWCWWDVRPHPQFGTVELRSPDVQIHPSYTVALAAMVQCLVATANERQGENSLLTEENKWLATRHGLDAVFYDFADGEKRSAGDLARRLVEELRGPAQDLGCENELEGILEIVKGGSGAQIQRANLEMSGSLKGMVDYLIANTASG
ncbi:carboxylate-amine ligase [soil metagenome]